MILNCLQAPLAVPERRTVVPTAGVGEISSRPPHSFRNFLAWERPNPFPFSFP